MPINRLLFNVKIFMFRFFTYPHNIAFTTVHSLLWTNAWCQLQLGISVLASPNFLTASKYCGSGLKIDLVVVVVVVIKLLSNLTAF